MSGVHAGGGEIVWRVAIGCQARVRNGGGRWYLRPVAGEAVRAEHGPKVRVSASATAFVPDGVPALLAVRARTEGITLTPLQRIDSRGACDIAFADVAVDADALLGSGADYVDSVLDQVLAAEMLDGAMQAFETTIEYMKTRVQFDRPIGSFQALQHRAAELLGELVLTRGAVYGALETLEQGGADAPRLVSLAKATAGDCFRRVAQEMIQLHGGIGMTDEHDAGLYLKRAHVADHTLGNVALHRARHARLIDI